jgi:hypothetical protein
MEQRSDGGFNMNRFLPFISCAFVGILVSSCAQNPHCVVPEPAYGSASGSFHRLAKRHHVALAQVRFRHAPRKAASEGQRRPLRPWDHLPAASENPAPTNATAPPLPAASEPPALMNATVPTHTDHLPTDPHVSTPPHTLEIRPPHYWRWEE